MRYPMQTRSLLALYLSSNILTLASASSILFTDATIITFNNETSRTKTIFNSSLLVEDDRITQIYDNETPTSYPNGTKVIDASGKIISPGFIDTHHHLWQTAFKTIASNTTLAEYFQRYGEFGPSIQNFTPDDKYLGTLAGALELLYAGTTTVLDHSHGDSSNETADAILNGTIDSGIRAYHGFAIHTIPNNYTVEEQIAKLVELSGDERLGGDHLVSLGLAFDAFEGTPKETLDQLWDIVQSNNLSVVTTHYLGGPWQIFNSPTLLNTLGWLNTSIPIVFSHASFITSSDITALRATNQYISVTPESEMHYGHSHPFSHLIEDQAALGVDTHFTYSTEMVGQARLWLQKLRLLKFEEVLQDLEVPVNNPMSVEQAFYLITRAGALALRREDIGIIAVGAKADLAIFDGETPNLLGWEDAVAAIILHSNVGDIEHVLVDGKFVKKDGKLTFEGYGDVKKRFIASAKKIQSIWKGIDSSFKWADGQKFLGITDYGFTEEIDTLRGEGTGY